jgi:hypothetical protein
VEFIEREDTMTRIRALTDKELDAVSAGKLPPVAEPPPDKIKKEHKPKPVKP